MSRRHTLTRDRLDDLRREKGAAARFNRVRAAVLRRSRPGEPLVDRDREPVADPRPGSLRAWLIQEGYIVVGSPDDADEPRKGSA